MSFKEVIPDIDCKMEPSFGCRVEVDVALELSPSLPHEKVRLGDFQSSCQALHLSKLH
jgi:hypothetical protein